MKAFWWNSRSNFGDTLTPLLLHAFSGIEAQHVRAQDADIVVVGSVLEAIPLGWKGIVAGAGKMYEATNPHLDRADVRGLRGNLSAKDVPGTYAIGDPGLLADELVPVYEKVYELGVVAHWSDDELVGKFKQYNPLVIDCTQDALTVIGQISSCKKIVSSSLHGLVVADAFNIPRRAELFSRSRLEGGDFKYRDYASAIGLPIEFGKLQSPHRWRIEEIQRELFDMFGGIK